jgi:hypothetical protein
MEKPAVITITTFWLDWLLLPILLTLGWLTLRWALGDYRKASKLREENVETLPAWTISFPLMVCAAGWVVLGFASLIKQEYWEHRVWCIVLAVWSFCAFIGAVLILINLAKRRSSFCSGGVLNFIGLLLIPITICVPAFMEIPTGTKVSVLSHLWTALSVICVGCLLCGMIGGFPYNFPRFALAIGILIFIGLGGIELDSGRSAFPWFSRIWDLQLEQAEFEAGLTEPTTVWRIIGVVKLILGIGLGVLLILGNKLVKSRGEQKSKLIN